MLAPFEVELLSNTTSTTLLLLRTKHHPHRSTKMSAPNQGRQSPEPEQQSDKQLNDPVAGNPNQQGADSDTQQSSKDALKNLESNPKHILEDAANAKTSKST